MADVPSLYRQVDALLLPTLLESFSGTYVEAMFHGKPIFTSNYEFATDVCQGAALYFDPLDVLDIFQCIRLATDNPNLIVQKIVAGKDRLRSMLNWNQAFDAYMAIINGMLKKNG
jgi:glycosyltransferase involved in cell wall biosynthesis